MTDQTESPVQEHPGELPPDQRWPQVPAVDSAVYGFVDPAFGNQMVAMNIATWKSIIHDVNVMKMRLDQLSAENIDLKQGRHPEAPRIVLPN